MLPAANILIHWTIPFYILLNFLKRMSGDLRTRSNHMRITNIVILVTLFSLLSCRQKQANNAISSRPGKNEMADLNRYLVQKDRERIKNYIERKNLKMSESSTGLWYQIIKEGTGKNFTENDKVVMNYECSLLDGTRCYSSNDLGPKEVVLGRSEMEQGMNEGLRLLKPGAEAIFIIPPFLAYGLVGDRKMIPSRAVIVYNVNILQAK
jgi:FKBP-type peptidyl-prolyl cis-trans isomerase FkpA